jgi:hypothetical protein
VEVALVDFLFELFHPYVEYFDVLGVKCDFLGALLSFESEGERP